MYTFFFSDEKDTVTFMLFFSYSLCHIIQINNNIMFCRYSVVIYKKIMIALLTHTHKKKNKQKKKIKYF